MRKTIGFVSETTEIISGLYTDYIKFAEKFGNVYVIPPTSVESRSILKMFDLIFLPGGADVSPLRYGEDFGKHTSRPSESLEYFDSIVLPDIIGKLPIFGICRGMQTFVVACGGSLLQDVWPHAQSRNHDALAHWVKSGNSKMGVNSFHHQAVNKLPENFNVLWWEEKLKFPEAVECPKLKFAGVQWHPERIDSGNWAENYIRKYLLK